MPRIGVARTTRSLLFTSGKGGVGTSNLVLNLAIALGEMGQRVVVVDADLGLANLDLLCGLTPRYDLGDVLAGRCRAGRCGGDGPWRYSDRARGARHPDRCGGPGRGPARLVAELGELESESDFVLVDAGSGLGPGVAMLAAAADQVVIVSTPEPTSIADAHAAIGRFRRLAAPPRLRVLVNQAASAAEAADVLDRLVASSRQFLGAVVSPLGPGSYGPTPRPPGGPQPPAVLDGVPGCGRLARRSTAGPRLGQGTPSAGPQPPRRLLRGPRRHAGHCRLWRAADGDRG